VVNYFHRVVAATRVSLLVRDSRRDRVIHNDRIDRLAALLVRYTSRFNRESPVPVVDRQRIVRLRLAMALALAEAKSAKPVPRPELKVLRNWLIPLNLPFRVRRRGDSPA
jgi:hypothetical protein